MTIPAWPSVLPLPQMGNYSLSRVDLAARRSLQVGYPIARQRSTRQAAAVIQGTLVMSDLQMSIFESWWRWTLISGVAWFSLTLPTDGGISSPTSVTARCTDGYRASRLTPGLWQVVLPLQIDSTVSP